RLVAATRALLNLFTPRLGRVAILCADESPPLVPQTRLQSPRLEPRFLFREDSGPMADEVTYERRGPAAILTIDRPDRPNAVDGPTADLLSEGYERFESDDSARVLILTGAGGGVAFCAGADLKAIASLAPRLGSPARP